MDSTLLDQIRHLCRDRASYERLKAILVQQERVLQLSWEERHQKLMTEQALDTQASNIFSNILAREKALAQLADAIQRSPSLELVLQVAVQVAQKVLQIDRVAIFRRHHDGRGEFVTDAIASGLASIADMPERQLLLSRHMIESMQTEQSAQAVDNIRSSSLSSHLVTLLEQIGISTYAANKIYAGHEAWGTLVAFHGSIYHSWSESDRTSLSLLAAQIGIAISLANLRQQSQILTDDVQNLQIELDGLQKIVSEIISNEPKTESKNSITLLSDPNNNPNISYIAEPFITLSPQDIAEEESQIIEVEISESKTDLKTDLKTERIDKEILDAEYVSISQGVVAQNGLPHLFLIPEVNTSSNLDPLDPKNPEGANEEDYVISEQDNVENPDIANSEQKAITDDLEISQDYVPVTTDADDVPIINAIASDTSEPSKSEFRQVEPDQANEQEAIASENPENENPENIASQSEEIVVSVTDREISSPDPDLETPEIIKVDLSEQKLIESENSENLENMDLNQVGTNQDGLESSASEPSDDDNEPAIEPQFIETILSIANHQGDGVKFLLNVIDTYLEETPILVQALDKAIAVNNHPRLLQILNALRSNSDYIGALPLSHKCLQLESAVRANYTVLIYACLSQVAIESQRAIEALRIERSRYI